ncbi:olfactory receptor 10A4-like, partial [Eublepharis macularius]|uniref:Olfactory receptor 10A4-like n=1 Tax=Eublepharis macularius TaxID=481883 RepID=A0AA97K6D5_EUBMA
MMWSNQTELNEFILLGFSSLGQLQILLFVVFLLIYIVTLMGNTLIILITRMDIALQNPMYFFLQNLAFAEVGFITTIVPEMLVNLLPQKKTISVSGCRAQIFGVVYFVTMECFLFIVMAYDRFVTICNPLRYAIIMGRKFCMLLVTAVWTSGIPVGTTLIIWLFSFPFCGSNTVPHFFCDAPPILQLVCGDTSNVELFSLIGTLIIILCPFLLILVSYTYIIGTILRMPSAEGRRKAFSTCSSHIIVVTLFYGSTSLTHFRPKSSYSAGTRQLLSLSYTVFTPMLNPLIYTLRNKEVRGAMNRLLQRSVP